MPIKDILNSNFLQTIIIFITGLVVLLIYFINKYNEKKDAASIIISEIRIAEKGIQEIKNKKFIFELSVILPNDTWQYKKHLFLNSFDEDEINLINDFYYKCTYAELYRSMVHNIRNEAISEKSKYAQDKLIDLMYEYLDKDSDEYVSRRTKLIEKINQENWLFEPNTPLEKLIQYIENIVLITPTRIGEKLKKISK